MRSHISLHTMIAATNRDIDVVKRESLASVLHEREPVHLYGIDADSVRSSAFFERFALDLIALWDVCSIDFESTVTAMKMPRQRIRKTRLLFQLTCAENRRNLSKARPKKRLPINATTKNSGQTTSKPAPR
jgi:hypothetical protein